MDGYIEGGKKYEIGAPEAVVGKARERGLCRQSATRQLPGFSPAPPRSGHTLSSTTPEFMFY